MANGSTATKPAPVFAPSGVFVTDDDYLLLTSYASVASIAIVIGGRVLDPSGRPVAFSQRHVPNSDRTAATVVARLGEGWLQQVSVGVASGTPSYGQAYARVDICRGDGAGRVVLGTLIEGHVTATVRQAWPGSLLHGPLERGGTIRSLTGTNPAAGVEISETVPTGARWELLAWSATLVTDATVANRNPALLVDDGTNTLFIARAADNHAASLTIVYSAGAGLGREASIASRVLLALPLRLTLLAGYRIRTVTGSLQAGDDWSAPQFLVEESLEGN